MVRSLRFLGTFVLLFSATLEANPAQIESLSYEDSPAYYTPTYSRAIFNLSSAVPHNVFSLQDPSRVVIDLENTALPENLALPSADLRLIDAVRTATQDDGTLRVVLDLKEDARPKVIILEPDSIGHGHRLFIDLFAGQ